MLIGHESPTINNNEIINRVYLSPYVVVKLSLLTFITYCCLTASLSSLLIYSKNSEAVNQTADTDGLLLTLLHSSVTLTHESLDTI